MNSFTTKDEPFDQIFRLIYLLPNTDNRLEAVDAGDHVAHGVDHCRNGVDGRVVEEQRYLVRSPETKCSLSLVPYPQNILMSLSHSPEIHRPQLIRKEEGTEVGLILKLQ